MSVCPTCGREDFDSLRAMTVHHSLMHPDSLGDRLWHQSETGDPDECWIWVGHISQDGYGQIGVNNEICRSHRVAYRLDNGEPAENFVCHHCDEPLCVNPNHLYDGTPKENQEDAVERGRIANGTEQHDAELCESQVKEILKKYNSTDKTQKELGEEYGVSRQTVSKITRRITWKHVTVES